MDFKNLVTPISVGGLPASQCRNAALQGVESGVSLFMTKDVMARQPTATTTRGLLITCRISAEYPRSLRAKRLKCPPTISRRLTSSTRRRAALGGLNVYLHRSALLNKRNTALANGFATIG